MTSPIMALASSHHHTVDLSSFPQAYLPYLMPYYYTKCASQCEKYPPSGAAQWKVRGRALAIELCYFEIGTKAKGEKVYP